MKRKLIICIAMTAVMTLLPSCGNESTAADTTVSEAENAVFETSDTPSDTSQNSENETEGQTAETMPAVMETDADFNDGYYLPFTAVLNNIPGSLLDLRDSGDVNDWLNSPMEEIPASVGEYHDLYSFITHFSVTREEADTSLAAYIEDGQITAEDLDVIYSGDLAAVTAAFASEYSIAAGDKIYSPEWIYTHPAEDYAAAGITAEDIKEKVPAYSQLHNMNSESAKALSEKLSAFVGETVTIEVPQTEEKAKETAAEAVEEDVPEEVYDDIEEEVVE